MKHFGKLLLVTSILLCVAFTKSKAQLTSEEIRDATAAGPYPFYVTLGFTRTGSIQDFRNLSKDFHQLSPNSKNDRKSLRGLEGNFGFTINGKALQNFYSEGGYRFITRTLQDDHLKIKVTYKSAAIRAGMRVPIFYPITGQIQGGIFLYREQSYFLDSLDQSIPFKRQITFKDNISLKNNFNIPGWEIRGRLIILDPIGTSGGLGFFVEWRFVKYKNRQRLDPVFEAINSSRSSFSDRKNRSFTIGIVAPLALRLK